ncbi:aldehyde dehydrogenase family protein [Mycolicibacter longobardus]|uniref:Aldehyde dehydrogenase n=1 Tax=Mycolicibacter longobardus TaxID=1108812 RepID=A0A1X1YAS0_9MYCO|nr:aldehyde dehydrogenase family protein [Mycolicibacter longobardus]ORW08114.1 aldehyde dehydrogenase [Mycolicibacter longobardus]
MVEDAVSRQADEITGRLHDGEAAWGRMSLVDRRKLLERFGELTARHASEWIQAAARVKGLSEGSPLIGEEWISGPWAVLGYVGALRQTLQRLENREDVLAGFPIRTLVNDQLAVKVLPAGIYDRLLLNGFTAEVWMQPGVTENELRRTAGLGQRDPAQTRGVVLVLGAGNIFSIAPLDALYQLYAENRAVVLKLNPITDPLKPVFDKIFAPFIDLGVLEIVTGGVQIGSELAYHEQISAVHMTGSEHTHDAIVWGSADEARAAKESGRPKLDKPITSELGGVAPVIIVPGRWSQADLTFQARHVATQRLHNSGSNCIAAQIVLVSSDWEQKDAFLAELRAAMAAAPARPAWYPGSDDRIRQARERHPEAAAAAGGTPARTLLTGLHLGDAAEDAFDTEYFAPVLGVSELPGTGADFLRSAIAASNQRLRGTLGANIIIHPMTRKELGPAFARAIADLRYGTIGINAWTGVGYLTPYATWGAFPGHTLDDVQSGIGVVHNALLLERTERTVVDGPFRPTPRALLHGEWTISPKPPWFVDNRTAATTGKLLTSFAARPRWSALPAIFASALRG